MSEFGRIDVLYNLAARSHFRWLEGFTDEEWDAAHRDEVDLVFYLTRAAWPQLKASRGVVVNMASLNGSLSFKIIPSLAHTTNKAAIIGMTRHLQHRTGRCGSETGPERPEHTRRACRVPVQGSPSSRWKAITPHLSPTAGKAASPAAPQAGSITGIK